MLESRITPQPAPTPTYWLDHIDVAIELPMGPRGLKGPPGTKWMVGVGMPVAGDYEPGTLYLASDGKIYEWIPTHWVWTGVDLISDSMQDHSHADYLPLTGGNLIGPLTGTDARFTGNVSVPSPDSLDEAVNVGYLAKSISVLRLDKFLGDPVTGNAITTDKSWNTAEAQAIYQQVAGTDVPNGITGRTIGFVMRQDQGRIAQLLCDIARNLWFVRTSTGDAISSTWGEWTTLTPVVSTAAPRDPSAGGLEVPHGTLWIQTDTTTALSLAGGV
jgi:hypothetical protein